METVVQIAAVCLAAAILGAVLRQHSPETAAVLGLAVCAKIRGFLRISAYSAPSEADSL